MEEKRIECTVKTCKYNNNGMQECVLNKIVVTPIVTSMVNQSDESMCSSFRKKQDYENIRMDMIQENIFLDNKEN